MRIAVVGCGAMGSVYAARLASCGHDVLVVDAWADHVRAISEHGLSLSGPDGDLLVRVAAHVEVPQAEVDLVVLAVKAAHVADAAASIAPLIGEATQVLTIQNGLGSAEVVAEGVGPDRLVVGIASGFGASLGGPGRAHHNAMRALRFGAYGGGRLDQVNEVAAAWRLAGFDAEAVPEILPMQWEKLICNVAYSAPCALSGLTVGEVRDDEHLGAVSRAAATEAWEVARALDVHLEVADPVALVRDFAARMPLAKPSALLDVEAGRVSEIDVINGAIPREAKKAGLTAPVNTTLTALVRAREVRLTEVK